MSINTMNEFEFNDYINEMPIDPISGEILKKWNRVLIGVRCYSIETMRRIIKSNRKNDPHTNKPLSLNLIQYLKDIKFNNIDHVIIENIEYKINDNELKLSHTQISDIDPLSELTNLKYLDLSNTKVSDINPLFELINLKKLYLNNTQISDITSLSELINLETLYLNNTQIFNVESLSKLTNLKYLYLNNDKIFNIDPLSKLTNLRIFKNDFK